MQILLVRSLSGAAQLPVCVSVPIRYRRQTGSVLRSTPPWTEHCRSGVQFFQHITSGEAIVTATAKAARLSERTRPTPAKSRLRVLKRKVLDIEPARLSRTIQTINRADKRDDWFDFLRHVE